ncbi:MAG: trigger factor [Marinilabiliaceae bacterium]|nr:trigger factor [Marinilabiliaceae bacterium]
MNISKQNIDELNAVITMLVEKADYEPKVNDVLSNYRKKASMPGFRPGKVPAGLIKKMYGKAALVDEINKLVSENLSNYITENKLELLGEPLPSDKQTQIDFDTQDSFEFSFDVAVSPEFEVKLTKKDKAPYYKVKISDEMLDQQKNSVIGRFGKNEKIDKVTEKSMIKGTFIQVDDNGVVVEGGIEAVDSVISMSVIKDESESAKLLGAEVNSQIIFEPKVAFPNDTEISYILKVSKEEAVNISGKFRFTISEITEYVPAELNQDLFNQVYGEGVINSEEEFIGKIKSDLENSLLLESDYRFQLDIRERLIDKIKFDLPEDFLKRWVKATNKANENMTEEQIESEFPKFLEDIRWQLIRSKIITENEVKLEQEDILNNAKKSARIQFMQYGLSHIPEDYLESYAKDMLNNEEQRRHYVEHAMNDKVIDFIKEAIKLEEKEISRDEFNKLFDKK